jgi:hypothetical protein
MELYEKYYEPIAKEHDEKIHVQNIEGIDDVSCIICYPVRTKPKSDFMNFMRWYKRKTGAIGFTEATIKRFYVKKEEIMKNGLGIGQLMETMRYDGIKIKTLENKELIEKIHGMFCSTYMFKEELREEDIQSIGENLGEMSDLEIESIEENYQENEDNVPISEEFEKFWTLYKKIVPGVLSYNRKAVKEFERFLTKKINVEREETTEEMIECLGNLIDNIEFRGLRARGDWLAGTVIRIAVISNWFKKDRDSTIYELEKVFGTNLEKDVEKTVETERELLPMEKFWVWLQELIPKAISFNEEVEEAFCRLIAKEYYTNLYDKDLQKVVDNIKFQSDEDEDIDKEQVKEEIMK